MKQLELEQLQALEAFWRDSGAGLYRNLQPGLTAAAAQKEVASLPDIHLTEELLLWWGWHDGVPRDDYGVFAGLRQFISLSTAVALTKDLGLHAPKLILLTTDTPTILAECDPSEPRISRIYSEAHGEERILAAPSLGTLVDDWLSLIETGAWYVAEDTAIRIDEDKVPDNVWERGIT